MDYPDLEAKALAEFVGILLGDGSIGKYECKRGDGTVSVQHCVKVTLSSEEVEYIGYVNSLYQELFGINPSVNERKGEKTCDIRTFQKELFEFMTKQAGLKVSPKWDSAIIPNKYLNNSLEKHVLRGYFDTDGSLVLTDNNGTIYPRLEMKICPSPMQSQFIGILERKGFNFGSYDIGKGKVRIQMNGKKQLEKWITKIGFKNQKHKEKLERLGNGNSGGTI